MNLMSTILLGVLVILVLFVGASFFGSLFESVDNGGKNETSSFGECLTETGVEVYAVPDCARCAEQIRLFGESWEDLNVVECDAGIYSAHRGICEMSENSGQYIWVFGSGKVVPGVLTSKRLSEESGCELN
ncbi:MAG: hypothetical protein ABH864_05075 [archaeon]